MRQVSVISRYPISIGFRGLMGCQRDSQGFGAFHIYIEITLQYAFKIKLKINVAQLQNLIEGSHLDKDNTYTKT